MTAKEKYLKWKQQVLNDCGQCFGFRAKGFDINPLEQEIHICNPNSSCPGTCPALDLQKVVHMPAQDEAPDKLDRQKTYIAQNCFKCGSSEDDAILLPCRHQGKSLWLCTKCLPSLIHG